MGIVVFGTERIPGVTHIEVNRRDQNPPPIRTQNAETSRQDRVGARQLKISSFDLGLGTLRGNTDDPDTLRKQRDNAGNWWQVPNRLTLPPAITTTTISSFDTSAYRAANIRVHPVNTTVGSSSGLSRPLWFIGTKMFRTTSDSDPTPADSTLALTDKVTAAAEVMLNSTRGILVATNGTTDDVQLITDPTTSPPTKTTAFALAANDWIGAIYYMPNLGPGYVIMYGRINGVSGWFYLPTNVALLTAPLPVVLTAGREILDANAATTSLTDINAGGGSEDYDTGDVAAGTAGDTVWDSPAEIVDSDNVYATAGALAAFQLTDYLNATQFSDEGQIETIPDAAFIRTIDFLIEWKSGDNSHRLVTVEMLIDGSQVGENKAQFTTVSSSDTIDPVGQWSNGLRGRDIKSNRIAFRVQVLNNSSGAASDAVYVDQITLAIDYQMGGVQAKTPLGGYGLGVSPYEPQAVYLVAPEFQDEKASTNVPRVLWKGELDYEAAAERPTITLSKPLTLMSNISEACMAEGGVVVTGDPIISSSILYSRSAKIVEVNGQRTTPVDKEFGRDGYTANAYILSLQPGDGLCMADVLLGSQFHSFLTFGRIWGPISPTASITNPPLDFAESVEIDPTQRYRYRFKPGGGGALLIDWQYQPRGLFLEPLGTLTGIVKANGFLETRTPILTDALGPEEALKTLLTAWYLGTEISSTNTVRLQYSIDEGSSFVTWATFTSAYSKNTLSTPVLFRSLILEVALNHTNGSTGSPNGLPILIEGAAVWASLRSWRVYIDPALPEFRAQYGPGGIEKLWSQLATLEATSPVQTFQPGNGVSKKAVWTKLHSAYESSRDPSTTNPPALPADGAYYLEFEEVLQ